MAIVYILTTFIVKVTTNAVVRSIEEKRAYYRGLMVTVSCFSDF